MEFLNTIKGPVGNTSGLMVKTGAEGVLTALPSGTTNQYLRGDGTWQNVVSEPGHITASYARTTLGTATNTVAVPLAGFSPTSDILEVYINSTFILGNGNDYSISGTNIVKTSGTWAIGSVIDFVIYKNIMETTENLPYISFDKLAGYTPLEGQIAWDATFATGALGLANGSVLQVGQEILVYGKANGAIGNGQLVQLAGAQGDHNTFKLADPSEYSANPYLVLGIATNDIGNGLFGYVTWFGKVHDVYTTGFNIFDQIWADPTTIGGITHTEPTAPNPKIRLGSVVKVQTNGTPNGVFAIRPFFLPKIGGLQDVYSNSPTNGQVLTWVAASNRWENASLPAPITALSSLTDVTVTTPTNGQLLTYNGGTNKWTNQNAPSGGQYLGTAATKAIAYNSLLIQENIQIPENTGAYSAGEIEIAIGYEVDVPASSEWVLL